MCHEANFETDEGCVGAARMTRYYEAPYGCSPSCVACCVCLFGVCVPGGNRANHFDTQLLQHMIASMTNRCVQWDEVKPYYTFDWKINK